MRPQTRTGGSRGSSAPVARAISRRSSTSCRHAAHVVEVLLDAAPLERVARRVDEVVDGGLVRMHVVHGPAPRYFPRRDARSFMRALNTCDFDVPSAIPSSLPTSL